MALHILTFAIERFAHFFLFLTCLNLDSANVFAHYSKMAGSVKVEF